MSVWQGKNAATRNGDMSEVFQRLNRPLSRVAGNDRSWGLILGLCGIALLGAIVFLSLSHARHPRIAAAPPVAPPQAVVQAPAPPPPAPVIEAPPPPPVVEAPPPDPVDQWSAPAMIVDLSAAGASTGAAQASIAPESDSIMSAARGDAQSNVSDNGSQATPANGAALDEQFARRVDSSQTETAYATHLTDLALVIPQGTVVPAILETGINSDLPGFVRAVVSRDVHGFDGSTVLIPRGSKLIGQYRNAVAEGSSRAFVVWSRVLTPDGVSIDIGSPAADELGRGGLQGETNTHFFQRFGAAIMLSVISAGLEAAANQNSNGNTAIVIGSPQQASNVASIALQRQIDIPPTITVPQGQPLTVFVSRDLDFSSVIAKKP